jgi:ornithine decarboxylase
MKRKNFYSDDEWQKILEFTELLPTPFIVINLDQVRKQYQELASYFPDSRIHYSVKANPSSEIIATLHQLGCNFDFASIYEMDKLIALGVSPEKMLFGNTIKKASDIEYAYQQGVRLFATDCQSDIENIARYAPGSSIYTRILVQGGETADWPLSRKFGCHPMSALSLLEKALSLGLKPCGVSFHVGSQQRSVWQWNEALTSVAQIFALAEKQGIILEMVNMGGGFPARYVNKTHSLKEYAVEINRYLQENFGSQIPKIILEPGRSLVGNAGILVSEIITISKKSRSDSHRWVYLDAGKFNGLMETMGEGTKYPVVMAEDNEKKRVGEVILAGPTCDSDDIMYEKARYKLPLTASSGQRLYWLSTGAYTASYASVEFNGFPPIKCYFMDMK